MKAWMKSLVFSWVNSYITSGAGILAGLPTMWAGFSGLFDDPSTGIAWKVVLSGLGILVTGLMARDHTKRIANPT